MGATLPNSKLGEQTLTRGWVTAGTTRLTREKLKVSSPPPAGDRAVCKFYFRRRFLLS